MNKYDLSMKLWEREDIIINEIVDVGRYSVQCAGVDIILECEKYYGDYYLKAYNENFDCIDSKIVGLETASKILAFEEDFSEKVKYLNVRKSELNVEICREALNSPFIGICL